jgi:hypothetical protein
VRQSRRHRPDQPIYKYIYISFNGNQANLIPISASCFFTISPSVKIIDENSCVNIFMYIGAPMLFSLHALPQSA